MKNSEFRFLKEGEIESALSSLSKDRQAFLFTDENVLSLYGNFSLPYFAMKSGEEHKNLFTLESLLKRMTKEGLSRTSLLICMGGGVVSDVGGLAASLYMRGISHVLIPTTLLSQADACIGGKTGINFSGIKNLLGSFYFPEEIYFSSEFFKTLPQRELVCGMGEIVKCGALSKELFCYLLKHRENLYLEEVLISCVKECAYLKEKIVREDPFDTSVRSHLNLGHTTAHALEMGNFGLSHGESVLYGLVLESGFARRCGGNEAFLRALKGLCFCAAPKMSALPLQEKDLLPALHDKKNQKKGEVSLVVAKNVEAFEKISLPFEEYVEGILEENRSFGRRI